MIFNQNAVCCWPDRPIYSPKALKPQLQLAWHTQSCVTCPGHSRAMASSKKTVSSFPPGLTCLLSTPHSHWFFAKPPISCRCKTWDVFECSGSCGQKVLPVFLSTSPSIALALHMIWYLFIASCWHFFGHLLPQELDQFPSAEAQNSKTSSTNRRCLNLSNLNTAVKPLQTKWCCGLAISNWTASCLQRYSYHTRRSKPENV